jgi:hypothetical protein
MNYVIINSVIPQKLELFRSNYQELIKNAKYPVIAELYEEGKFLDPIQWLSWIPDEDKSSTNIELCWWDLKDFEWSCFNPSVKYLL